METEKTQLRAAIYARQSVGGEVQSASVAEQVEQAQQVAAINGYKVVGIFQDLNRASWTYPDTIEARQYASNDKAIQKALKESTKKEKDYYRKDLGVLFNKLNDIDIIIIFNQDRLYRSLPNSNLENFLRVKLIENKITVHSITEGVKDYASNMDLFISSITNLIKAKDLIEKKTQSKLAKLKKKNDGFCTVSRISGYKIENDKAVPNKVLPHIVTAFDMFLNGESKYKIMVYLQQNGIPNISIYGLDLILTNPMYAGYGWVNGNTRDRLRNEHDNELTLAKQFIGVEAITLDKWKQVQTRFKLYRKPSPKQVYNPIHTSLCYCGYCGGIMKIHSSNKIKTICCANWALKKQGTEDCKGNAIKLEDNKNGGKQLNTLLRTVAVGAYAYSKLNTEKNKETKAKVEALQYDMDKIQVQIKLKEQEIIDNVLDNDTVKSCNNILKGYNAKYKSIKNEMTELNASIRETNETLNFKIAESEIKTLPHDEINKILRGMLNKVLIYSDKVVIDYPTQLTTVERIKTMVCSHHTRTVIDTEGDWLITDKDTGTTQAASKIVYELPDEACKLLNM
jgi:DNA invertase Pin-like site-specific DNA recombinase